MSLFCVVKSLFLGCLPSLFFSLCLFVGTVVFKLLSWLKLGLWVDKVEGENGCSGGQSRGRKSYRIFFFSGKNLESSNSPWKNQGETTSKEKLTPSYVVRSIISLLSWVITVVFFFFSLKSWYICSIKHGISQMDWFLLTRKRKLLYYFSFASTYFYIYICLCIYNWAITGMHVIRTGLILFDKRICSYSNIYFCFFHKYILFLFALYDIKRINIYWKLLYSGQYF